MRYLIESDQGLLGALGFGAAAWKVGVRDAWIGWDRLQREAHLSAVVNNARFLEPACGHIVTHISEPRDLRLGRG